MRLKQISENQVWNEPGENQTESDEEPEEKLKKHITAMNSTRKLE
nr:hypothetical protein [Mycoplasmopsis bovis]